ncbi:unnamed protein product [Umbelopsis ramanniana]
MLPFVRTLLLKERLSLSSLFIVCRTLIEIVKRLNSEDLSDDLAENLEEIVFNQLKNADPELIHRSKNRTASMDLFAELIGALSNIRFVSVSDRFIAELEKYNYHAIMKEKQNKIEMLIRGMRYLKIKVRISSWMLCYFVAQLKAVPDYGVLRIYERKTSVFWYDAILIDPQ